MAMLDQAARTPRALRNILLAGAALPLFAAAPALAQDADAAAEDEVVVTGIRETLRTSIDVKKRETAIVDALSTEEIGDLPALSVGEAIQTITGATTHREKGGASEIALRGLGPFLSNTTFNGRDATNGSGDRAVNFNQFPSELVNNIKIYKSQQADLVEGGVAGTIDIGTLRPLDFGKMRVQGEIKANYSPYQDKVTGSSAWGWRGTLSYVDQYQLGGLGEVGIAIGVQRNSTNNPEETVAGSSTWTACNATIVVANNNCTPVTRPQAAAGTPFYLAPNAMAWRQISEVDTRDAVFGALQWQFSDRVELNLDAQWSDRTFVENRRDLNISEMRYGLTNVVYDENGVIQRMNGLSAVESTASNLSRAEEYLGAGANLRWSGDRLTVALDGAYSRTIRTEIERQVRLRTDPFDMNGTRNFFATAPFATNSMRVPYTYEVLPGNFAPTVTFDPRFDPNNHALFWDDARARRDESRRHNEIWGARLDLDYRLDGFITNIAVGGRWAQQTFTDYDVRNEVTLNPLGPPAAGREDARINTLCRTAFPQTGFLERAEGNSITSWATFDPLCLMREYTGSEDPGRPADLRSPANRDVTETTLAGYVMADYAGDLGDMPVRGNVGVRVVNTQLTSVGLRSAFTVVNNPDGTVTLTPTPGTFDTVTLEAQTTRVLPSVNAIFELQPNRLLLRAAAYRALSRPAPSALGAGRTFVLDASGTSVADAINEIRANGSPALKPLMSWNGDIALEYYPNRDSLFSATLYFKEFSGGFIPFVTNEDFVIGGQNVSVPVIQTANSDRKSQLWGVEVTLANRFSWLPKPLDGFGGKLSYNYADTDFENEDVSLGDILDPLTGNVSEGIIPPAGLSGFSKHVVSAQLYYEIGGFSLQGIYNYRSSYYQDFVGGNTQLRYVRGNETFDLRASFNVNRNISLRAEATNIFDSPKVTDMPVVGSIRQYHYYGPRYFIGARFRI
ncbi:TonB-dependent receptor [Sphingomonas sp. J315]|uniref:TonB-dependent receptor n=2 Tax=unclassified Sphingomonas TaxID=196159 RepID=UPI0021AD8EBA|nr:TonB-dependent receptor [Sphingomonas sp. J315]UUX98107.1 TonB-dependent receptor [Sphingomonas sp. J315]